MYFHLKPLKLPQDEPTNLFQTLKNDYESLFASVSALQAENHNLKIQFRNSINELVDEREEDKTEFKNLIDENKELKEVIQKQRLKIHALTQKISKDSSD